MRNLTWNDITIGKFRKIRESYGKHKDDADDMDLIMELISICYGIPLDELMDLEYAKVLEYAGTIRFIANSRPVPKPARRTYELGGRTYRTTMKPAEVTTSQYIDFHQLSPVSEERTAEFLAVLLVPEGRKYNDGYDLDEVVEDISEHLPVEDAMGLSAFFLRLYRRYLKSGVRHLRRLIRKARKEGLMSKEQISSLLRLQGLMESVYGLKG